MRGIALRNKHFTNCQKAAHSFNSQSHSFAIQYASLMLLLVTFLVGNMSPLVSNNILEVNNEASIGKEELPLNLAAGEQIATEHLVGVVEALKNHDLRANFEIGCKFEIFGGCFKAARVITHFLYRSGLSEHDFSIIILPDRNQATVHFEAIHGAEKSTPNLKS